MAATPLCRPDSVSPSSTELLQLVNENKIFSPILGEHMRLSWNLFDCGLDYNAIAVIGAQSTGKSTILNRVFGTTFEIMNERSRKQTTKGIWMGKAAMQNILVLDLEGSDGQERGDDQDFERKSTLFALAIAEVVIINMWETAIGLYNAANMSLLKTVLEVNLQLFQRENSPKTHLYFLIRDHCSSTPLESLSETIRDGLQKIWLSITNPSSIGNNNSRNSVSSTGFDSQKRIISKFPSQENVSSSWNEERSMDLVDYQLDVEEDSEIDGCVIVQKRSLESSRGSMEQQPAEKLKSSTNSNFSFTNYDFSQLFEVTVSSLPHMKLMKEGFDNGIDDLRSRFYDKNNINYAFTTNCRKNVPADGFPEFASTIWDSILENKDLDLPTQQELLAQFRCDALGAEAISAFDVACEEVFVKPINSSSPNGMRDPFHVYPALGATLNCIATASMVSFDKRAKRYSQAVYNKKRTEILNSMRMHASTLFAAQARNAHRNAMIYFRKQLDEVVKTYETTIGNIEQLVNHLDNPSYIQEQPPLFKILEDLILLSKSSFSILLEESKMSDAVWDSEPAERALEEELRSVSRDKKNEILQDRLQSIESKLRDGINYGVEKAFEYGMSDFSGGVSSAVDNEMAAAEKLFKMIATESLRVSTRSNGIGLAKLRLFAASALRTVLENMTSDGALHQRLKRDFEQVFRYDVEGVPRVWSPMDNMEAVFKRARERPILIIQQLGEFKVQWSSLFYARETNCLKKKGKNLAESAEKELKIIKDNNKTTGMEDDIIATSKLHERLIENEEEEGSDEDIDGIAASAVLRARKDLRRASIEFAAQPLVSSTRLREVSARFKMEADALYMEAKRAVVVQRAHLPVWVLLLLAVLGWNEFLFLLSSPITLILVLFFGAAGILLHAAGVLRPIIALGFRLGHAGASSVMKAAITVTGGSTENIENMKN